jgi:hypothetical protein
LLTSWSGSEGEPASPDLPCGSDYARACQADHPAALLPVGSGFGLVLGAQEHLYPIHWIDLPAKEGVALVGWMYGDDDANSEVAALLEQDGPGWRCLPPRIHILGGELLLLHAADIGTDVDELETFGELQGMITDAIPIRLKPGAYRLEIMEVGGTLGEDSLGCVLCRWLPADC